MSQDCATCAVEDWNEFEAACLTEPMKPADCAAAIEDLGVDCFFCACDILDLVFFGFYQCHGPSIVSK